MSRRSLLGAAGLAALATLAACAPQDKQPDPSKTPEGTSGMTPNTQQPSNGAKTLLVYFSRPGENYWEGGRRDLDVGNTKRLAQLIADRVSCDEFEIRAADPYPEAYDPTVKRNAEEQDADARPAIAGDLPDLSEYSTLLIGSPIWNVRAPMIMSTFIDRVDLKNKTVLPFVTYAVSGIDQDYRDVLPSSDVADGLAVRGEEVDGATGAIEAWLRTNGLL
jgi:flavodoxin